MNKRKAVISSLGCLFTTVGLVLMATKKSTIIAFACLLLGVVLALYGVGILRKNR